MIQKQRISLEPIILSEFNIKEIPCNGTTYGNLPCVIHSQTRSTMIPIRQAHKSGHSN